MTLILVLLLGLGEILIISAIECTSVLQTVKDVWSGDVAGYTWHCQDGSNSSGGNGLIPPGPIQGGVISRVYVPSVPGTTSPQLTAGPGASGSSMAAEPARIAAWLRAGWRP